ncbi:FAD-dependent oxidoreductase [Conexibacter sp. JD483]|uniref:NAD(P)/FAD-dependent oxidoreductase n=1 Tax=unclassified Conexibacter TaxID=2627773 RepID=UPI00271B8F9C|nr:MULTISPECIES: FAD-dependent oxidoreductase [unclassified Conexibacter]MDO8187080.1 FAD-dependent oxidoreductase [Conexibacter sp. CPCC 205706]MDO8200938.1 FAD-dependent oxidoreductase [Conexibacter sp. CPCC 205762]MDR9372218.1 FAD-dependent oxidoreductase [Conexibacter sp. JD483]
MSALRNGGVSFWYASTALPARRDPLDGDMTADVCIVGGGFTGLWTAYHLKRAQPDLDVLVVEREFCGFGASGRNGGWLSDHFTAPREQLSAEHGRDSVIAIQHAMRRTIGDVLEVCSREGIDADVVHNGVLQVARSPAQAERLREAIAHERAWGYDQPGDIVELSAEETAARIRVAGGSIGSWSPHCARIQPAKLVQGLASAVQRLGVRIVESTTVRSVEPAGAGAAGGAGQARAVTDRGVVRAPIVLTCLEGFTASLKGRKRAWLPLNSAIVVTAPLPQSAWAEIGWEGRELLGDMAHAYIYAQRTADDRIAFGGRGVPYRFGSRTDTLGQTQPETIAQLTRLLREFFPAAAAVPVEHAWCGVLGVPRDWSATVRLDRATGLGTAGGYVGNGVTTSALMGRTLADLALGRDSDATALPWVGHDARRWEPEPLRWIGANLVYALYRTADRRETASTSPRTSLLAKAAAKLAGM